MVACVLLNAVAAAVAAPVTHAAAQPRVTIVYDAFGSRPGLRRDWGFAALVEYAGRRILFDTGNDPAVLAHNVRTLRLDLRRLDFVVVSHRHGDHIAGLRYVLSVNPRVPILAPREPFGVFGGALPGGFYRRDDGLPDSMRYFGGAPPAEVRTGTSWPEGHFTWVDSTVEVSPGIWVVSTVSETPGTLELRELSLVVQTPTGALVVVGCSHPGIERILAAVAQRVNRVRLIVGGLHLVNAADTTIARIASSLRERWAVPQLAIGHCTGEPAFAALRRVYGADYLYAGVGTVISLALDEGARVAPD